MMTWPLSASSTRQPAVSARPPCKPFTAMPASRADLIDARDICKLCTRPTSCAHRPARALTDALAMFERWRMHSSNAVLPPAQLCGQQMLEDSGYVDMWRAEEGPGCPGPLGQLERTGCRPSRTSRSLGRVPGARQSGYGER